jgi:hypothetical protein
MGLFGAGKKLSRIFFVIFASANASRAVARMWLSAV